MIIRKVVYLDKMKIKYIRQYRLENCKNKKALLFDFYLPDFNLCIEYDGEQHFKQNIYWNQTIDVFNNVVKNDNIKNDYCMKNNINLLRISYKENVEKKLNDYGFGL